MLCECGFLVYIFWCVSVFCVYVVYVVNMHVCVVYILKMEYGGPG